MQKLLHTCAGIGNCEALLLFEQCITLYNNTKQLKLTDRCGTSISNKGCFRWCREGKISYVIINVFPLYSHLLFISRSRCFSFVVNVSSFPTTCIFFFYHIPSSHLTWDASEGNRRQDTNKKKNLLTEEVVVREKKEEGGNIVVTATIKQMVDIILESLKVSANYVCRRIL